MEWTKKSCNINIYHVTQENLSTGSFADKACKKHCKQELN